MDNYGKPDIRIFLFCQGTHQISANSSNIAFEVPLASSWWCNIWLYIKKKNWQSLCDVRPDCHHHFDASGISNTIFHELAKKVSDVSFSRNGTYVCQVCHNYPLENFSTFFKFINTRKNTHTDTWQFRLSYLLVVRNI